MRQRLFPVIITLAIAAFLLALALAPVDVSGGSPPPPTGGAYQR